MLVLAAGWVTYKHTYGQRRVRALPWLDLTNVAGPLIFPHATIRELPGPITLRVYLREHHARRAMPPPDFKHGIVLVVAVGPRSSTAYSLQVLGVVQRRNRVTVKLRENTPTLRQPGKTRIIYPYRMITFPKTGKPTLATIEGRP